MDGVTFKALEAEGEGEFIEAIRKELVERSYRPSAVKRVMIPKPNGKMRPLGIPTIKDRVAQMACKMVIECDIRGRLSRQFLWIPPEAQSEGCGA